MQCIPSEMNTRLYDRASPLGSYIPLDLRSKGRQMTLRREEARATIVTCREYFSVRSGKCDSLLTTATVVQSLGSIRMSTIQAKEASSRLSPVRGFQAGQVLQDPFAISLLLLTLPAQFHLDGSVHVD